MGCGAYLPMIKKLFAMMPIISRHFVLLAGAILLPISTGLGQDNPRPSPPPATRADVPYGEHPNQALDFWRADTGARAPLAVYIHGGGFRGGSNKRINANTINRLLAAGINVASVEYRFLKHAKLPAAHQDVARAIQFLRSKSGEWGIDERYIGAWGGSAGAQLSAYLAWHDDMADPDSEDPLARESTRLACVALQGCQSTMDLDWWVDNIPGYEKPHREVSDYMDGDEEERSGLIEEISVINHISPDDPPVYMRYGMKPDDPIPDDNSSGWKVHHVNFGIAMQYKLLAAGVEVTLDYPGPQTRFSSPEEFLIEHLAWRSESALYRDFQPGVYTGESGENLHYQILKPANYDPAKSYPLVLFLHGSGGRGSSNIRNLVDAEVPAHLASDSVRGQYPAFYLVPQCPGPNTWSRSKSLARSNRSRPPVDHLVIGLVEEIIAAYPVDRSRLYVTGLSMGGFGSFGVVYARPEMWAASVPVCGGWATQESERFTRVPMWLFHGALDTAVPVDFSRGMYRAIKELGGNIKYTEYPDVKHNAWVNAYRDPELWKWMFAQRQ